MEGGASASKTTSREIFSEKSELRYFQERGFRQTATFSGEMGKSALGFATTNKQIVRQILPHFLEQGMVLGAELRRLNRICRCGRSVVTD